MPQDWHWPYQGVSSKCGQHWGSLCGKFDKLLLGTHCNVMSQLSIWKTLSDIYGEKKSLLMGMWNFNIGDFCKLCHFCVTFDHKAIGSATTCASYNRILLWRLGIKKLLNGKKEIFQVKWRLFPNLFESFSGLQVVISSDRSSYSDSVLLDTYRYSFLRFWAFLPIYKGCL